MDGMVFMMCFCSDLKSCMLNWTLLSVKCSIRCVCVCVCVCERERERESVCVCVCVHMCVSPCD